MEDENNNTSGFQDACEAMNDLDQVSCWICLGDKSDGDLKTFCSCPGRLVHEKCLARWCLQQAGREEEKKCRFCAVPMPDYRAILNPSPAPKTSAGRLPMIKVRYGQTVVVMPLQPGEAGKKMFERDVKKALNLPESHCLKINFECHAPGGSVTEKVKLEGMGTYDAAFWCASQTAAERAASKKKSSSTGGVPTSSPLKSAKIKSSSAGGVPPSSPLPANANSSSSSSGAATAGGRSSSGPILMSGIRSSPSGAAGGGTAGSVQVSSTPAPLPPTGPKPRRMSLPGWQLGQAPVSGAAIASAASTIRAISSGGSFVVPSTSTTTTIVYPRIVKIHGDPGVLPRVAPPCRPHPAHLLPASAAAPEPLLEKGQESSDGGLCVAAMAASASLAAAAASSAMMIQSSDLHYKMDSRRKSAANHDVVPRSGGARRGMMRRLSGLIFSSS